jgi:hypothetical protein
MKSGPPSLPRHPSPKQLPRRPVRLQQKLRPQNLVQPLKVQAQVGEALEPLPGGLPQVQGEGGPEVAEVGVDGGVGLASERHPPTKERK